MSERELRDALLRGEDPIDLVALTTRVLRRDRRRMWLLGAACVVAWMLVVLLPWATILPMLALIGQHVGKMNEKGALTNPEQQEQLMLVAQAAKGGTIATFVGSIASMFVAAVCTVSLILLSRRATLRQVNARLAEISNQLRALARESK